MKKTLVLLTVAFVSAVAPAFAEDSPTLREPDPLPAPTVMAKPGFFDRHPLIYKSTFPIRRPLQAAYNCTFPFRHPLQTGKWCESSGFNGLLGAAGGIGSIATPAVVGILKR